MNNSGIIILSRTVVAISDLPADKIPAKHVPYRTYSDENYYTLILTTPPIFSNIPSTAMNMPKITHGSLGSQYPCSIRSDVMTYLSIIKASHLLVLVCDFYTIPYRKQQDLMLDATHRQGF